MTTETSGDNFLRVNFDADGNSSAFTLKKEAPVFIDFQDSADGTVTVERSTDDGEIFVPLTQSDGVTPNAYTSTGGSVGFVVETDPPSQFRFALASNTTGNVVCQIGNRPK